MTLPTRSAPSRPRLQNPLPHTLTRAGAGVTVADGSQLRSCGQSKTCYAAARAGCLQAPLSRSPSSTSSRSSSSCSSREHGSRRRHRQRDGRRPSRSYIDLSLLLKFNLTVASKRKGRRSDRKPGQQHETWQLSPASIAGWKPGVSTQLCSARCIHTWHQGSSTISIFLPSRAGLSKLRLGSAMTWNLDFNWRPTSVGTLR